MAQVLIFGARWCPVTAPLARALAREGVQFDIVDCEKSPESADRHGVVTLPTVVVLDDDGQETSRFQGAFWPSDVKQATVQPRRRRAQPENAGGGADEKRARAGTAHDPA